MLSFSTSIRKSVSLQRASAVKPKTPMARSFRQTGLSLITVIGLSLGLSACIEPGPPVDPPTQATASRFLQQATFGSSKADIDHLVSVGWEAWMTEQFTKPITDSHFLYVERGGEPSCDTCDVSGFEAVTSSFWYQAVEGEDQLRQRVAFALSELFVVSAAFSTELIDDPLSLAAYHDMLLQNAFGNFRDILDKVAKHPTMGAMLSHKQNDKDDPSIGRLPDENFAREIMQLFTIGKWMLNSDGTRMKDANGKDIPAYNMNDIMGMAKAMTGWSFGGNDTSEGRWRGDSLPSGEWTRVYNSPMQPYESHHSTSEKRIVNGVVIPAGTNAETSMQTLLDTLFMHPNTPPFIATQLIKRLVTSNPSPAFVDRVAAVFISDKNGVRGNMQAVVRAILFDPEAYDPNKLSDPTWGKLREPIIRITNYARAFNARSGWGTYKIKLANPGEYNYGQIPWQAQTVFNFFSPDYQPPGALANQDLTAPEFQIFNESTSAGYLNILDDIALDKLSTKTSNPIVPNYSAELALADNPSAMLDRIALLLNGGYLSDESRTDIVRAMNDITATQYSDWKLRRVKIAVLLMMASPDYLIQK